MQPTLQTGDITHAKHTRACRARMLVHLATGFGAFAWVGCAHPADGSLPVACDSSSWTIAAPLTIIEDVALTPSLEVAVAGNGSVQAAFFDADGLQRWTRSGSGGAWRPTVATTRDGAIVWGELGGVTLAEPDGTVRFTHRVAGADMFDVDTDAAGHVFAAGYVPPDSDVGSGEAVSGIVLVSYERDGRVRWARVVTPDGSRETRVAAAPDGTTFVVTVGRFVSFGPDGTELWRKRFNVYETHAVTLDARANVLVSGMLCPECMNDFGTGDLGFEGNGNGFVASYERDGTPRWARRLTGEWVYVYGLATDPDDNVYVTGHIESGPLTIDGLVERGVGDRAYVASYDANGSARWVMRLQGVDTGYVNARAVAFDACRGQLVVGGFFSGDATFRDGTVLSAPDWTAFLTRFSP